MLSTFRGLISHVFNYAKMKNKYGFDIGGVKRGTEHRVEANASEIAVMNQRNMHTQEFLVNVCKIPQITV